MMIDEEVRRAAARYALETGAVADLHEGDYILRFLLENPCFPSKDPAVRYYFEDGLKSARQLSRLMADDLQLAPESATVLEFACGYGCVTRHLVGSARVPNVVCSDVHEQANEFLRRVFGVETIQSTAAPEDYPATPGFDLVFCLSFFSHMPPRTWSRWLRVLFDRVRPGGFLAFTTHGRASRVHFGNPPIPETGIWFRAESEQKDLDTAEYGQTIVDFHYVLGQIESELGSAGGSLHLLRPGYWWEHQDLYVVRASPDS
ncbi:MAG: class I SAM-dependent methyltransferase [Acidobacteriota bacterium]|nr:class I SAM-dependent methyltransferase [Acidobacteriota bacterium]